MGPGDDLAYRVQVGYVRPGAPGGQGRGSCVGKEVEDLDPSSRCGSALNDGAEPVPVDCLLGEEAGVLETEGLEPEGEVSVADRPLLGKVHEFPLPAAFAAAVVMGVRLIPDLSPGRLPNDLRIRTDQLIASPQFQLFSV